MAPQATEQTLVDTKLSRLLFGRLPVRISKGKVATLSEIPFKFLDPTEETSRYYLYCTTKNA